MNHLHSSHWIRSPWPLLWPSLLLWLLYPPSSWQLSKTTWPLLLQFPHHPFATYEPNSVITSPTIHLGLHMNFLAMLGPSHQHVSCGLGEQYVPWVLWYNILQWIFWPHILGSILSLLSHCLSWKFRHFYSKLISTNLFSMLLGSNLLGVFISSFRVLDRGVNPISQKNSPICINYLLSKFVFYPFCLSSAKILAHTSCPSSCWYMLWQRQRSIRVLSLLYLISISHSQLGSMVI